MLGGDPDLHLAEQRLQPGQRTEEPVEAARRVASPSQASLPALADRQIGQRQIQAACVALYACSCGVRRCGQTERVEHPDATLGWLRKFDLCLVPEPDDLRQPAVQPVFQRGLAGECLPPRRVFGRGQLIAGASDRGEPFQAVR